MDEIKLVDGVAVRMGDGAYVVQQRDEYGAVHSTYLRAEDLQTLQEDGN